MNRIPALPVITGPTATGKTALGVLLAKELGGEVVSADSMQIYRRMDIGTAKVTKDEMDGVPHHMIDVAEPDENYSVSRYVEEADKCIKDIIFRGKLPILVGGTGLYIDSLISGRDFAGGEPDLLLRKALDEEYLQKGGQEMLDELSSFDPERAEKLHPADKKRILRAFEVYRSTGKTITEHDKETKSRPPRYRGAIIVLSYKDRQELYSRIDSRVDSMIEDGLISEVKGLLESGIKENSTGMQAIGYKEIVLSIKGEIPLEEAINLIKRESRRYAKRQLTWWGRYPDARRIQWNHLPDFDFARHFSTKYFRSFRIE